MLYSLSNFICQLEKWKSALPCEQNCYLGYNKVIKPGNLDRMYILTYWLSYQRDLCCLFSSGSRWFSSQCHELIIFQHRFHFLLPTRSICGVSSSKWDPWHMPHQRQHGRCLWEGRWQRSTAPHPTLNHNGQKKVHFKIFEFLMFRPFWLFITFWNTGYKK